MKNINMKLDLNADPKSIGLFAVAVFVASRAGARRVISKQEGPRPYSSPYVRYDRMGVRRPRRSGNLRGFLSASLIDVLDRGIHGEQDPIHRSRPVDPEYGTHVRTQRALDRINNRLDAMLEYLPEPKADKEEADVETRRPEVNENLVVSTSEEATEVVRRMRERINTYGNASLADLYELLGIPGKFSDIQYGWKTHEGIGYTELDDPEDGGWRIDLPEPEKL